MSNDKKINPTVIITGFLGAGKTTYLNSVLNNNPNNKYCIIENEFGKESIDSDLIMRGEEDVMEINNGCLCCTLNEGFYDILNELYAKRHDFDELIIEATGIADPRGIAAPFLTNPPIKKQFPLRQVICIVDAALIDEQLEHTEEAIHQITFSDILLINKLDLVDANSLIQLKEKLSQLNPLAKIFVKNEKDIRDLHHESPRLEENALETFQTKGTKVHNHKHTKGIKSVSLSFDQPFDIQKLRLKLQVFLMFQTKGLYRMKGVIWLKDSDDKYLLQSVGTQLSLDSLKKWKETEKRKSTIVLIGKDLKKSGLEKMFSQCQ